MFVIQVVFLTKDSGIKQNAVEILFLYVAQEIFFQKI